MEIWVRKCSSFEEEQEADREFWAKLTPEQRVAAVEELRMQGMGPQDECVEGLRRTVRVLDGPES